MAASLTNRSMVLTDGVYLTKHNVEMSWLVGDRIRTTEGTITR